MLILRIIFTFVALIFMSITFIIYLKNKKILKNEKKLSKDEIKNRIKKFNIMLIISLVLSVIAIVITIVESSNEIKKNVNIDATSYSIYLKKYKDNNDIKTTLSYFPEEIESSRLIEFSEYSKNGLFAKSYFIFLKYQYDKTSIKKEIERISSISIEKIEDDQNPYYIYIISDNENNIKEYVLVDNNNRQIIYVFNQYFNKKDSKDISDYFID